MTKEKIIIQLEGLVAYANDYIAMSQHDDTCECADIWAEDKEALKNAILTVKMFSDIFENLEGQGMLGEMVAILNSIGYEPEDFDRLNVCTAQKAKEYIEYYTEV